MKLILLTALLSLALAGCATSEPAADDSMVVPASSRPDLNPSAGESMADSGAATMSSDEGG